MDSGPADSVTRVVTAFRVPCLVGAFDANCYLYLSRAMDRFDLSEHGGSYQAALSHARGASERDLVIVEENGPGA